MKASERQTLKIALFAIIAGLGLCLAFVRKNVQQDAQQTKTILESKRYIFKAESLTPARGMLRQLTGTYDLYVNGDTVVSYLPYFGRAYTAPLNDNDAAIKFTSVNSEYSIRKTRRSGWQIEIIPKDTRQVRELILNVSDNGRGTLLVVSNDRDRITFDGYVSEMKQGR